MRRNASILLATIGLTLGLVACQGDTAPATDVGFLSAELRFQGEANNGPAYSYFEYWKATAPNARVTTSARPWPAGAAGASGERVAGLSPDTAYSYRVCGNDLGKAPVCGRTLAFRTSVGEVRYLSPTGSDANDGRTPSSAWRTFQHAAEAAPSPATVYLLDGTYPFFTWSDWRGRTDYVRFTPDPGARPTVAGFTVPSTGPIRTDYLAFEGLSFTGPAGLRGSHIQFTGNVHTAPNLQAVLVQDGSSDIHIQDNRIGGGGTGTGIFLSSGPGEPVISDVAIRRNVIDGVKYVAVNLRNFAGVVVEDNEMKNLDRVDAFHTDVIRTFGGGTDLVVRGNFLHDNEGIQLFIKDGAVSNVLVENNVISRTVGAFNGVKLYDVSGLRMTNNTVEDDVVFGDGTATDVVLFNNIIQSFGATAGGSQQYDYRGQNLIGGGTIALVPTEIPGRATYLDPAGNDYRLAAGSLGIDQAASGGGGYSPPPLDRLRRPRPANSGTAVDIGAHERQANDP